MLALHPNDRLELYSGICSVTNNDWQEVEVAKTIFEILSRSWSIYIYILLHRNAIGADESRTLSDANIRNADCDVMPLWLSWSKWRKSCGTTVTQFGSRRTQYSAAASIFCAHGWPQQVPMSMLPTSIPPVLPSVMLECCA